MHARIAVAANRSGVHVLRALMLRSSLSAMGLIVILVGCGKQLEEPAVDMREPVAILFVAVPTAEVRQQPSASAPVISTYRSGEAVSLLASRGEWVEVRTGTGSGWMLKQLLSASRETRNFSDNNSVRFRQRPLPVGTVSKVKGEIVLEALINTDGAVTTVSTIRNSTGSADLERRNREELQRALFEPIVIGGQPKTFLYTYRVTY